MRAPWHSFEIEEVFRRLSADSGGLSAEEVRTRFAFSGANELPRPARSSPIWLFLAQFYNPLVVILLAAIVASMYLHHYSDAVFMAFVLFINAIFSFWQEYKVTHSLEELQKLVSVSALVMRLPAATGVAPAGAGRKRQIDGRDVVPGDIVLLRAGDRVPADARLIESKNLRINESTLTGEWEAAFKEAKPERPIAVGAPLAERSNMAYSGSLVTEGEGRGIVVGTGIETELGDIVRLLAEEHERPTPLQRQIAKLSRFTGFAVILLVAVVIMLGHFSGASFGDVFVTALALAVSAVPVGLLPAITIILVLGMRRMLKKRGLVRSLAANETLGSVTVICTDKTGTLTRGDMEVGQLLTGAGVLKRENGVMQKIAEPHGDGVHALALSAAVLCNEAFIENPGEGLHEWVVRGSPTEKALLLAGMHVGENREALEAVYQPVEYLPFNSASKFALSLRKKGGRHVLFAVGAPEALLARCQSIALTGRSDRIDSHEARELIRRLDELTGQGHRVVACAYRQFVRKPSYKTLDAVAEDLSLLGLFVIHDPLRADAKESFEMTRRAGIRTIIITGDHRHTAQSIMAELGLPVPEDQTMEGQEIDRLTDAEFDVRIGSIAIFARVSPAHKLRIVKALQRKGEVVAMVGDGVNDAPALKAADIGVAVGSGTDVAKEAADIVLLDNSFRTIVSAVEQGRVIFANIRKVFIYLVADDFSELFIFLAAFIFQLPLPLVATQILWINLVEDGLPDIALTTEQETDGVMDEPPRPASEGIINRPVALWMTSVFFISGLSALGIFLGFYAWLGPDEIERVRTLVFVFMGLDSLTFAFSVRSFHKSVFRRDIFSNHYLVWASLAGLLLLLAGVYTPPLQSLLSTVPMTAAEWGIVAGVVLIETVLIAATKKLFFTPPSRRTA